MTKQEIQDQKNLAQKQIFEAEAYLSQTDYIAAKLAEGAATREEYAEELSRRQGCRDSINAAQERIKELDAIVPEDENAEM